MRGALYVHRDALRLLDEDARARVERADRLATPFSWNVARLEKAVIGLLRYPDFDRAAFPRLEASARVNLQSGAVRRINYAGSPNPLILHRKELLVSSDHPGYAAWARVTERAERAGLFRNPGAIGRQRAWAALLAEAGLDQNGERLW